MLMLLFWVRTIFINLVKNGKKITLLPLKSSDHPGSSQASSTGGKNFLTITRSEAVFLADCRSSREVHALVIKGMLTVGDRQIELVIPLPVQKLLEEFVDVIPNDVSPNLPLMRSIQHAINFVLKSTLPNLLHYRISPKENETLADSGQLT